MSRGPPGERTWESLSGRCRLRDAAGDTSGWRARTMGLGDQPLPAGVDEAGVCRLVPTRPERHGDLPAVVRRVGDDVKEDVSHRAAERLAAAVHVGDRLRV